jgi:hypothetical protein
MKEATRNQRRAAVGFSPASLGFLHGLFFELEDGSYMFL